MRLERLQTNQLLITDESCGHLAKRSPTRPFNEDVITAVGCCISTSFGLEHPFQYLLANWYQGSNDLVSSSWTNYHLVSIANATSRANLVQVAHHTIQHDKSGLRYQREGMTTSYIVHGMCIKTHKLPPALVDGSGQEDCLRASENISSFIVEGE